MIINHPSGSKISSVSTFICSISTTLDICLYNFNFVYFDRQLVQQLYKCPMVDDCYSVIQKLFSYIKVYSNVFPLPFDYLLEKYVI
jgi:hypothetical protein